MRRNLPVVIATLAIALLFGAGCAGHVVRPKGGPLTLAPKPPSPIPVAIGINSVEQKVSGGFPDLVPIFKNHLDKSGLFRELYYPLRPTDKLDGTIQLKLSARFQMDGGTFPKAFITGFFMFLPAPLIWYDHEYQAEGTVQLLRGDKLIKTYEAKSAVTASMQLFAPVDQLEAEGTKAAADDMCDRLVDQMVRDFDFLSTALKP